MSEKLCSASAISARLPDRMPPTTWAMVHKPLAQMAMLTRRSPEVGSMWGWSWSWWCAIVTLAVNYSCPHYKTYNHYSFNPWIGPVRIEPNWAATLSSSCVAGRPYRTLLSSNSRYSAALNCILLLAEGFVYKKVGRLTKLTAIPVLWFLFDSITGNWQGVKGTIMVK